MFLSGFGAQLAGLHYLDNAASEPIRPEVARAMQQAQELFGQVGGNPSAAHRAGRIAAALLEQSRTKIARALGADPAELIFTGGGSESVSLALLGLAGGSGLERNEIWYSAVEHESVSAAAEYLCNQVQPGRWQVRELPVDHAGVLDLSRVELKAKKLPAVISVMLVGNENGVCQPVSELVEMVRTAQTGVPDVLPVMIHTDAIQAVGRIPVDFHALGVDALSATGHKFGGPASAGFLLMKRECNFRSPLKAAGQERALRGGTQDIINAVGLATAVELAVSEQKQQAENHFQLRKQLLNGIAQIPGVTLATTASGVPGIIQLLLSGCEAEALLLRLDQAGICASAGSACHTGVARPSKVLIAQGYSEEQALGTLRLSFGWNTKTEDVAALLAALPDAMAASRRIAARH